jgi:hypothetical protein
MDEIQMFTTMQNIFQTFPNTKQTTKNTNITRNKAQGDQKLIVVL